MDLTPLFIAHRYRIPEENLESLNLFFLNQHPNGPLLHYSGCIYTGRAIDL